MLPWLIKFNLEETLKQRDTGIAANHHALGPRMCMVLNLLIHVKSMDLTGSMIKLNLDVMVRFTKQYYYNYYCNNCKPKKFKYF